MSPSLLALVLASAVAAPAPADDPIKPPQGPPPTQVLASVTKEGDFEITQTVMVPETRNEARTVVIDGRAVTQTVTVTAFKTVQVTHRIKGEGVKVYTVAGKEVDAKDVPDKLKKPIVVLFAADGNKVDPFYLKIIKPDTLIVVAPLPTPPAPVRPAAAAEEREKAVREAAAAQEEARAAAAKRAAEKEKKD